MYSNTKEEAAERTIRKGELWNGDLGKNLHAKVQEPELLLLMLSLGTVEAGGTGTGPLGKKGTLESATNNRLQPNVNSVPDTCAL